MGDMMLYHGELSQKLDELTGATVQIFEDLNYGFEDIVLMPQKCLGNSEKLSGLPVGKIGDMLYFPAYDRDGNACDGVFVGLNYKEGHVLSADLYIRVGHKFETIEGVDYILPLNESELEQLGFTVQDICNMSGFIICDVSGESHNATAISNHDCYKPGVGVVNIPKNIGLYPEVKKREEYGEKEPTVEEYADFYADVFRRIEIENGSSSNTNVSGIIEDDNPDQELVYEGMYDSEEDVV